MTAAQIYDRIKEVTGKSRLDVRERAFRNYVVWIRKEYGIKKPDVSSICWNTLRLRLVFGLFR